MINWDEVDKIKQRLLQRAKYGITCADDDLNQLLKFLDQFHSHPFDPEDRGRRERTKMDKIIQISTISFNEPSSVWQCYGILYALTESGKIYWQRIGTGDEWQEIKGIEDCKGKEGEG